MADYGHDLSFGIFVTPAADAAGQILQLARRADEAGLDWVSVFPNVANLPSAGSHDREDLFFSVSFV